MADMSKPVVMSACAHEEAILRHTVDVVPEAETFIPELLASDAGKDDPCLRRYHQSARRKEAVASAVGMMSMVVEGNTERIRTAIRNPTWLRKGACSPERNMRIVQALGADTTHHPLADNDVDVLNGQLNLFDLALNDTGRTKVTISTPVLLARPSRTL